MPIGSDRRGLPGTTRRINRLALGRDLEIAGGAIVWAYSDAPGFDWNRFQTPVAPGR